MKAQQPYKNTVQLVALATTAAPSTWQNIMFWNIDGAAKHLIMYNLILHRLPAAGGVLGQAHRRRWGRWGRWSIRLHWLRTTSGRSVETLHRTNPTNQPSFQVAESLQPELLTESSPTFGCCNHFEVC